MQHCIQSLYNGQYPVLNPYNRDKKYPSYLHMHSFKSCCLEVLQLSTVQNTGSQMQVPVPEWELGMLATPTAVAANYPK